MEEIFNCDDYNTQVRIKNTILNDIKEVLPSLLSNMYSYSTKNVNIDVGTFIEIQNKNGRIETLYL